MPQRRLAPHRGSGLRVLVVALLGLTACTDAYCCPNQQLALSDQEIYTYDFASLPCAKGDYSGNFSVEAFSTCRGDQLCNTNPDNDRYFESVDQHYGSGFQSPLLGT